MALLTFLLINGLLIVLLAGFIRKPATLMVAIKDFAREPFRNLFLFAWMLCALVAGWGVLSDGRLSWMVVTPWFRMQSWQLAGLLTFAGLGVLIIVSAWDNHRLRKRYEND